MSSRIALLTGDHETVMNGPFAEEI